MDVVFIKKWKNNNPGEKCWMGKKRAIELSQEGVVKIIIKSFGDEEE